jgi:DNA phosphorothioation-dependent restriction protein DptG
MTLQDLYTRVAELLGNQCIADCLGNSTFLEIYNSKITFKTFVEVNNQASLKELNTEYILPRFILLWKMTDSMWFMEGAENEIEFKAILKAKTDCWEVTNIIRVDSDSEVIEIVRDNNKMISIDEVFRRKRRKAKGRKQLFLLPS